MRDNPKGPAPTAGLGYGSVPCSCAVEGRQRRIAITGGPGAGKTAVLEMARRTLCEHVAILPESASIVFGGGFPRNGELLFRRAAQRAIFHIQRELERVVLEEGRASVVLCDRGTLDGLAYWPDSDESYWAEVGSSAREELARYDAVVHLHTPPADQGYEHGTPLRIESAAEAAEIDRRIGIIWSAHPRRVDVASTADFFDKVRVALEAVRALLPECCRSSARVP